MQRKHFFTSLLIFKLNISQKVESLDINYQEVCFMCLHTEVIL